MTAGPNETSSREEDAWLARQVALGSSEALEALYDRYARIVLSFLTRLLGDSLSGEDLLQEVFLRVWRQAGTYSPERGSFVTWLLSISHNMAIDELRKRKRRPQRADSADPVLTLAGIADTGPPVELQAELSELRDILQSAVATLPEPQRISIEMAYFRGMTQQEIATALDVPLGTIKTRMRLGMRKLRDHLNEREGATS